MRKLLFLFFPAFVALLVLNCSGDNDIPCATCDNRGGIAGYYSHGYCLYNNSCEYMEVSECFKISDDGKFYANDSTCGDSWFQNSSSSSSIESSSSETSSSSNEASSSSVVLEPCVDSTLTIGSQIWQRCNSNVEPSSGSFRCYDDEENNCEIYGKLYDWETAKSACQDGFHLPTKDEWLALMSYVESENECYGCAGKLLKSKYGWNGEDTYDFSALPGGAYFEDFFDIRENSYWWSADEVEAESGEAKGVSMSFNDENSEISASKDNLFSVRCLQDE